MGSDNDYRVGIFINDLEITLPSNQFSFNISDNIHTSFPTLNFYTQDASGVFLELGAFTQGLPLKVMFGLDENILEANFRISSRNDIATVGGVGTLNGKLEIQGIHDSFFVGRESPNIAIKNMTVSDAVRRLFQNERNLFVENTNGHIEAYVNNDPYRFTREVLLPQATNGRFHPYYFFRNLQNELYFESSDSLERRPYLEKLQYGGELAGEDLNEESVYNIISAFLPFNEKLENTLADFHVNGGFLSNDLLFEKTNCSVASNARGFIPVVVNSRPCHFEYYNRQFNPCVDYELLNTAFSANAIRKGVFIDKILLGLPFHPSLVSGRVINTNIHIVNVDCVAVLSEAFSGDWLIEQSKHTWNGPRSQGATQLILCRSSMLPSSDSLIRDLSFRD